MSICVECGALDEGVERGWRGELSWDEDGHTVVYIFCPRCAAREFGDEDGDVDDFLY